MAGEIGRVIKKLRAQTHLRQADLSKACGVKQPNLSRIEKGHCEPRHATLLRIAEALGVTVDEMEAEAARMAAGRSGAGGAGDGAGAAGNTASVPVFDGPSGCPREFDADGRPAGEPAMTLELPPIDAPYFGCRVRGDAMVAAGADSFADGDIVVFAREQPGNGGFGLVRTAEGPLFRQVFFEADGVRLVPRNRSHAERLLPAAEVLGAWRLVQHIRMLG